MRIKRENGPNGFEFYLQDKAHRVYCGPRNDDGTGAWFGNFYRRNPRSPDGSGGGWLLLGCMEGAEGACRTRAYDFMLLGEAVVPPKPAPLAPTITSVVIEWRFRL